MIHTDEDDEFERIERENNMKGQPYHYAPKYVAFMDVPHRPWVGLTEEEIGLLTTGDDWSHVETPLLALFARAIEAKLKEKNAGT